MQNNTHNLGWMASSVDPAKMSQTVDATLKSLSFVFVFFATRAGVQISGTELSQGFASIVELVTIGGTFYNAAIGFAGLVRKVLKKTV